MAEAPARNLELKVRCDAAVLAALRARLRAEIGEPARLRQVDTYFEVPMGRLKLRQLDGPDGASAELIAYARPDAAGPRWSAYHLVPLSAETAAALTAALAATAGVRSVVAKERQVWLRQRTRIHLDTVAGLGTFVELETVLAPGDEAAGAAAELAETAALCGLDRLPAVAESYGDLAVRSDRRAAGANTVE